MLLKPLFRLCYSGTLATLDQRLSVISELLAYEDEHHTRVGLSLIQELLDAENFTTMADFDFGARVRTYGYWPNSLDDVRSWYSTVIAFIAPLGDSHNKYHAVLRRSFERQFRGLWAIPGLEAALAEIIMRWSKDQDWPGAWIAIRETLHYDGSGFRGNVSRRARTA